MKFLKLSLLFSLLLLLSIVLLSCGKNETPKSSLIVKNNLLYKNGSDTPFTGTEKALVDNKIIEYEVKDGLKHGKFRIYSADGKIEIQGQIDSNRNVGKWQYFYPNGTIESEGSFNFDLPEGRWIWNYPDGKLKEEGIYENGERVGMWYQYDNKGGIINKRDYGNINSINDSSRIKI